MTAIVRGSIRVDARRAMEKLREHLLVDLELWALEIVRAAVAGGARRVDVAFDADDVVITFDGAPLDPAALPRLLDHVLEHPATNEARRARLLALGVNAALGLGPAFVDVVRVAEKSSRARWTPALIEREKRPEPEEIPAPEGAAPGATRVQVRRRLGLGVLMGAISRAAPRAIELLGEAAFALPVPITLDGRPFPFPPRTPALVRVPFEVRGFSRAFVEIVQAARAAPAIELLEHGVLLASVPLWFDGAFPWAPALGVTLPARVVVDAEELPTNASRSALREDAGIERRVAAAALPAFVDALRALAAVALRVGEIPPGALVISDNPIDLEDALGAVAIAVLGAAVAEIPPDARAVLDLPLLRLATGQPVSLASVLATPLGRGGPPLHVWMEAAPVEASLAPWMREVIWIRGRVAERALTGRKLADAASLVAQARAGAERRRRLLERAAGEPRIPASAAPGHRVSFDVTEGALAGLRGEVSVAPGAPGARKVHVFVEGRILETLALDPTIVPIPIEAAIAWENRLIPRFTFDGVERGDDLSRALHYAAWVGLFVIAREVGEPAKGDAPAPEAWRATLRAAIGTLAVTAERLGLPTPAIGASLRAFPSIHGARAWPTTSPRRWESARSLALVAEKDHAICAARPGPPRAAANSRPVITAEPHELAWLAAALGDVEIVPYDRALSTETPQERDHRRIAALAVAIGADVTAGSGPVLPVVRPGARAVAAPSASRRAVFLHAGEARSSGELPASYGPVVLAIDDDAIVPVRRFDGLADARLMGALAAVNRELCGALVAALEGDPAARARFDGKLAADASDASPAIRAYLLDRAAALVTPSDPADAPLAVRIEALPLLSILDARGVPERMSLAALREIHPSPLAIPVLDASPGFETLRWRPVIALAEAELAALSRWSGGRVRSASADLEQHRAAARRERERRAFLAGPAQDPRALGDLAEPGGVSVFIDAREGLGICVAAGLPRASAAIDKAWIDVMFGGRALCRRALADLAIPVVARVSVTSDAHVDDLRDLSPAGIVFVGERVRGAAGALASAILERAKEPGQGAILFGDPRAIALVAALAGAPSAAAGEAGDLDRMLALFAIEQGLSPASSASSPLTALLRSDTLLWPTVQGEAHPIGAIAASGGEIWAGAVRHVPWRTAARADRPSDLDRPILLLPATIEDAHLEKILGALGLRPKRVTDAIARLQERRGGTTATPAPRLSGAPAHPALRLDMAALGLQSAEGEVEIIEGPTPEITLIDASGAARPVHATLPMPLRAILRVDVMETGADATRALLVPIERAAGAHLVSLIPRLDELPVFARAHLRRLVCSSVGKGRKIARKVAAALLFEDLAGTFHALDELRSGPSAPWGFTTDPPPHAEAARGAAVIRLSDREAADLARSVPIEDRTAPLRRELEGERRARAAVMPAVLDGATRVRCLAVVRVDAGGLTGEAGLLMPEYASDRGVAVLSCGRPLCRIDDRPGWPCVAVVDAKAAPNRGFDGFADDVSDLRVRAAVREAVARALRAWAAPPEGALGVRVFERADGADPISFAGVLWLPREWPAEPRVRMRIPGREVPRPIVVASPSRPLYGVVPVEGRLVASGDGPWPVVAAAAFQAAVALLEGALRVAPDHAAIPAYQWDLRLLGAAEVGAPRAPTADGGSVSADEVITELRTRGALWFTTRRGSVDGEFPEAPPAFVVLDEASPLVTVLRHRSPPRSLRELGGEPAQPVMPVPPPSSPVLDPSPIAADPAPPASIVDPAPPSTRLSDLFRSVGSLFSRTAPPDVETPLSRAVQRAVAELDLQGNPVTEVLEARSGRPVRYEPARCRVLLNTASPALHWLGASGADDARAIALLAAAVVTEVNRALVPVTDDDECRALAILLAKLAASSR